MTQNWSQPFQYWILSLFVVVGAFITWYARELFEPLIASISILARYIYRRIQSLPPWPQEESELL